MKAFKKSIVLLFFGACLNATYSAETVGIFSDNSVEQIKFAVGDIKTALEAKSFTVEILPLSSLTSGYANKKVVVALSSNSAATTVLTGQGGTAPAALGEQAYALITTTQGQTTYWAFGGDANGAMYGGLQLAENIGATGFTGTNTAVEKPFMMNRGLKLNLPLDKRIPTYVGNWTARSAKRAIPAVWDSTFWKDLIDQQARFRYNMLSVWVHHPFPALVKVAGYENACLPDIQGFDGFMRTDLTPDARVAFWRRIMQYAHNRGMSFYFFNWNVVLDYAKTQIPGLKEDLTTQATKDYLYKSMQALIATYPELDGFGTTTGDNMPNGSDAVEQANVKWSWDCYGKAVLDYLAANPSRKFNFIHRSTGTSPNNTFPTYAPLSAQPNANMDMSVKYAVAHMYSTTTPRWTSDIDAVAALGKKTWATVRNDDYVYINWGDPQFVREFINGFPHQEVIKGIYIGADGWSETKTYFYKNGFAPLNGGLEVKRRWYMQMLWGRLSYNPSTTDDVFKNMLAKRYPQTSSDNLFTAWTKASRPLPKMTELVMGNWDLDHDWWPEACWSDPGRHTGFRPIAEMAGAGKEGTTVAKGSTLCDIKTSAAGTCGPKKNSYTVAT